MRHRLSSPRVVGANHLGHGGQDSWATKSELSPEQAMAQLRRIQRHSASINRAAPMACPPSTPQAKVLVSLNVKKPDTNAQMSLL